MSRTDQTDLGIAEYGRRHNTGARAWNEYYFNQDIHTIVKRSIRYNEPTPELHTTISTNVKQYLFSAMLLREIMLKMYKICDITQNLRFTSQVLLLIVT